MSKMRKKATELRQGVQSKTGGVMGSWGSWRTSREWVRGLFHFLVGFTGWLLLQIIHITMELLGVLLLFIGLGMFLVEILRVYLTRLGVVEGSGLVPGILRWLSNYLYRDVEKNQHSNLYKGFLGLGVAWVFCYLAQAPWIAAGVCLAFSLVDPLGKFGKRWPIVKFKHGLAKGKSVGGFSYGLIGGLFGVSLVVWLHLVYRPFFPPQITAVEAWLIYLVGIVAASLAEFISGKWDNFFIPVASSVVMVFVYLVLGGF